MKTKKENIFQRAKQRVSATEVLQELSAGTEIKLFGCNITGQLDVNRLFSEDDSFDRSKLNIEEKDGKKKLILSNKITFDSCTFEGDVFFSAPWDKPDILDVVFQGDIMFNSSVFSGQAQFSNALFEKMASFDGVAFKRIASFRYAHFQNACMFRTVEFHGYGLFTGVIFHRDARFTNTFFSKGGNFTDVEFLGKTDFAGVYSLSKSVPMYESVYFSRRRYGDDETFWRFIKQASQEAGYYQLAGESFYNERCAYLWRKFRGPDYDDLDRKGRFLRFLSGFRLLPELVFGKFLFGYGERPIRVLMASAIIIFLCGIFYSSSFAEVEWRGQLYQESLGWIDGMYFSTITFTTLGFGDMFPRHGHTLTKIIAMAEALAGACLMALFVVSLSKRYSRG